MLTQQQSDTIYADELTEGDLIRHFTGALWQVANEPSYTPSGIEFEVLDLATNSRETQRVCFYPEWRFELIGHEYAYPQIEYLAA